MSFYITGQLLPATRATHAAVSDDVAALAYADRLEFWALRADTPAEVIRLSHAPAALTALPGGNFALLCTSACVRVLNPRDNFKTVSSVSLADAPGAFRLCEGPALLAASRDSLAAHFYEGFVHLLNMSGKSPSRRILLPEACGVLAALFSFGRGGWLGLPSGGSADVLRLELGDGDLLVRETFNFQVPLTSIIPLADEAAFGAGDDVVCFLSRGKTVSRATPRLGTSPAICALAPISGRLRAAVFSGVTGDVFLVSISENLEISMTCLGRVCSTPDPGPAFFIAQLGPDRLLLGNTVNGEPSRLLSVSSELQGDTFFSEIRAFPNETAPVLKMAFADSRGRATLGLVHRNGARFLQRGVPAAGGVLVHASGISEIFPLNSGGLVVSTDHETFALSQVGDDLEISSLVRNEATLFFQELANHCAVQITPTQVVAFSATARSCWSIPFTRVSAFACSREVDSIAIAGDGNIAILTFPQTGAALEMQTVGTGLGQITAVALGENSRLVFSMWNAIDRLCSLQVGSGRVVVESQGVLITSLALTRGEKILAGLGDGRVQVYSPTGSGPTVEFGLGTLAVRLVPWRNGDSFFACCDRPHLISMTDEGVARSPLILERRDAVRLSCGVDGKKINFLTSQGEIVIGAEFGEEEEISFSNVNFSGCQEICFAPTADAFVLGSETGGLAFVDPRRLKIEAEIQLSHNLQVTAIHEYYPLFHLVIGSCSPQQGRLDLLCRRNSRYAQIDSFDVPEGSVSAICNTQSGLAVSALNVVRLFDIVEDKFVPLRQVTHNYLAIGICSTADALIVGDLLRSVSMLSLSDLSEVKADTTSVDQLVALSGSLSDGKVVCADMGGRLRILGQDAANLYASASIRVSERVNAIVSARRSLDSSNFVREYVYSGASGAIRLLYRFDSSDQYERLSALQTAITRFINNAEDACRFLIDKEMTESFGNSESIPILDADILKHFFALGELVRTRILQQVAPLMTSNEAMELLNETKRLTSASRF